MQNEAVPCFQVPRPTAPSYGGHVTQRPEVTSSAAGPRCTSTSGLTARSRVPDSDSATRPHTLVRQFAYKGPLPVILQLSACSQRSPSYTTTTGGMFIKAPLPYYHPLPLVHTIGRHFVIRAVMRYNDSF